MTLLQHRRWYQTGKPKSESFGKIYRFTVVRRNINKLACYMYQFFRLHLMQNFHLNHLLDEEYCFSQAKRFSFSISIRGPSIGQANAPANPAPFAFDIIELATLNPCIRLLYSSFLFIG